MTKLGVTATDVSNAVQAQNRQNPAVPSDRRRRPPAPTFNTP